MDIHLPKIPHNWRELGREIGIIVLGVLIALFFEELVQAWDWSQKIRAADQAMRTEILSDDGPELYNAAVLHPCVVGQLNAIRAAVESGKPRAQVRGLIDRLWIPFVTYDSTAYTTTEASQVSLHFNPEKLGPYTQIYASMPIAAQAAASTARDKADLRSLSRTGGALSEEEANHVLSAVEQLRNDDNTMWGGARYLLPFVRAIGPMDFRLVGSLKEARAHYGTCVKDLSADFPAHLPPFE